jgi:glycosyltransferase involved in cell wall biosynthesis
MGLGVVAVASPITINNEIVDEGINGFLVKNNDWETALLNAIAHKNQFDKMGVAAKEKINSNYSFTGNFEKYFSFLAKSSF